MTFILLLFLSTTCPETELINISKEPWDDRDDQEYVVVKKRCKVKFPNSPCLKKFIKVRPLMYRAICGKKE